MRPLTIQGTAITTSPLGFGCAGLFREPEPRRRTRLLEAAHAAGILHFDVAPMYGLGLAERELGRFARSRRDRVTIATKFGIALTPAGSAIGRVQQPIRRLLAAAPDLRHRARSAASNPTSGSAGAFLYREVGFDAAGARASHERSLRELGTDYVDLLLLHDPHPGGVRSDEVCSYLEAAQDAGTIRAWGLTGEPDVALAVVDALPAAPPVLQVHHDILMRSPAARRCASFGGRITYGILGAALERVVRHVAGDAARRRRWEAATGYDCAVPRVVAPLMLREAAAANPSSVVLFSTTQEQHLHAAIDAFVDPPTVGDETIAVFEALVAAEVLETAADA